MTRPIRTFYPETWHNSFVREPRRRSAENASLYVAITELHHPIKIGITTNVPLRLRSLNTASSIPLRIGVQWDVGIYSADIERSAHRLLNMFRMNGEWFVVPEDFVYGALRLATKRARKPDVVKRWLARFPAGDIRRTITEALEL